VEEKVGEGEPNYQFEEDGVHNINDNFLRRGKVE
jgi:hypothetical protein